MHILRVCQLPSDKTNIEKVLKPRVDCIVGTHYFTGKNKDLGQRKYPHCVITQHLPYLCSGLPGLDSP